MEAKKRIFYLDFIRAISMIIIVTYHFAVHFTSQNLKVIRFFADGKWGLIGVAMFFVISGASLMYNYSEKIELKTYYKKRFLVIYPMFWFAYSAVFLKIFYDCKGFFNTLPIYKLIYSFLGMDGYLSPYTQTVYLIGEWFIGCIILIYILFPLLRLAIKKFPKAFLITLIIVDLAVILFSNFKMPVNQNLIVCTTTFVLGMYFMEYAKKCKIGHVIIALIVSIILCFIKVNTIKYVILIYNILGYTTFVVLYYIGEKINISFIKNIVKVLSKYSYAIFLVHHYIIQKTISYFENVIIDKYGIICVYLICAILIGIFAKVLYEANKNIIKVLTSKEA